jgi:hypothetical protein
VLTNTHDRRYGVVVDLSTSTAGEEGGAGSGDSSDTAPNAVQHLANGDLKVRLRRTATDTPWGFKIGKNQGIGLEITGVTPGSPADEPGVIQEGWFVAEVNGEDASSWDKKMVRTRACVGGWVGWVGEWAAGCVRVWVGEWLGEWLSG